MPGPETTTQWSVGATRPEAGQRTPPRLPPGYRWIAVRPGAPPATRPRRRPLGPTPRYLVMPRWGLVDHGDTAAGTQTSSSVGQAPAAVPLRVTLAATVVVLSIAALVHLVRYLLLVINRTTLLNPLVAASALWLGVAASVVAIVAAITCAMVLTRWLIARRAAAFRHNGRTDPRPRWALWVGCLLPPGVAVVVALSLAFWLASRHQPPSWALMAVCMAFGLLPLAALVWVLAFVLELVRTENQYDRMATSIWVWWLLWVISSAAAVFATETSFARDAQGIANNTAATTGAYLLALTAVIASARIFEGFEREPVERPAHRWVIVGDERPATAVSAASVELEGQEPAA